MFTHKPVQIPELETKTVDRKRFYLTPEGKMYPSITTVLQKSKMQGLMEWRKRVGDDVANYIARTAAQRGTKVHHMCEDLINNKEVKREPFLAAAFSLVNWKRLSKKKWIMSMHKSVDCIQISTWSLVE